MLTVAKRSVREEYNQLYPTRLLKADETVIRTYSKKQPFAVLKRDNLFKTNLTEKATLPTGACDSKAKNVFDSSLKKRKAGDL